MCNESGSYAAYSFIDQLDWSLQGNLVSVPHMAFCAWLASPDRNLTAAETALLDSTATFDLDQIWHFSIDNDSGRYHKSACRF